VARKEAASYAAVLGILKAGGAYVPLPADGPVLRWHQMLAKAEVGFVLGQLDVAHDLICIPFPEFPDGDLPAWVPQAQREEAYVLFTSGSTGGPKGVSVSRANVASYLKHLLTWCTFTEEDRFTQFFALTFDLSVHDLFVCWGAGACLCVPGEDAALRAASFARDANITVWFSVPSVAALMQRMRSLSPHALPTLRYAFFCGEALSTALASAFAQAAPHAHLFNLYGPTEATIAITAYAWDRNAPGNTPVVPIGKPFPGHRVRLEEGELLVAGPQISTGYVNDAAATERSFVQLPDGDERWYRTGDRASMDELGDLHFQGRIDDQVKVLGHRVEPAEVDHVLRPMLNGGSSATVPVRSAHATRLVTFVDVPVEVRTLMELCRTSLPAHMVPERIIVLPELPLTAHGKVDRKQLIERAADA
jgi:amino acid adenylation domain-containing protein